MPNHVHFSSRIKSIKKKHEVLRTILLSNLKGPQGYVLGPLLFLIYNDLERNIKSNVNFFADDTMLYSIVNDPVTPANDSNHALKVINQWAYQWKMEFHPDPNKQATELLFSCKKIFQIIHHFSSMVL